jgi:hypothetical protein
MSDQLAIYLRQSTIVRLREHSESTRQDALADEAAPLGWERRDVVVMGGDRH